MPKLNLFLSADAEVEPSNIIFNQSVLAPEPALRTKAQRKALHCILSNVGKYKTQSILFNMRNQANAPEQYNPYGYGHKPLLDVLKQLQRNGLLTIKKGTARYLKRADGDFEEAKLSSFSATIELVSLCTELGYTPKATASNTQQYVELKNMGGKLIPFEETAYSNHTNALMAEYCEYLNEQHIEVDGEELGHFHLVRKYKDWDGSRRLIHGGRIWHPFVSFSGAKRERAKMNGSPVVTVDYPASVLNVLYKLTTGKFLEGEDPYSVDSLARSTVKYLCNCMINNPSQLSAASAATNRLDELTKAEQKLFYEDRKRHRSIKAMMKLITDRNAPIAECFFQGKAAGQRYAWHEQNLVFEVARLLARMDVPALTVHDEFIVPVDMVEAVHEVRYTTAFTDLW